MKRDEHGNFRRRIYPYPLTPDEAFNKQPEPNLKLMNKLRLIFRAIIIALFLGFTIWCISTGHTTFAIISFIIAIVNTIE